MIDARKLPTFQPQFEFGSGMSFTSFEYSDLRVSPDAFSAGGIINISLNLRNTGTRAGKETAILYVRDEVATLTPAAKRVRRFAKVDLKPGESKRLEFTLRADDLGYIGLDNKPVIEPGEFTVMIGGRSAKFTLR